MNNKKTRIRIFALRLKNERADTHPSAVDRANWNQMRRISEKGGEPGGVARKPAPSSPRASSIRGNEGISDVAGMAADSKSGTMWRGALAIVARSDRTTCLQHSCDDGMFIWPQSAAICLQQSASLSVIMVSGKKHASCGTNAQTSATFRARTLNRLAITDKL